jgi:lipopolysaccharide transport system ATP-binding protein
VSDIAIKVENLGKRYRIGATVGYKTLRESLFSAVKAPFRRLHTTTDKPSTTGSKTPYIWALRNASFQIERGQAVGIIGRNGSGKSTMLKILSRITRPTEGRAEIYGRVASLLEVGTGFHPELTGRENINLSAAVMGMKNYEVKNKIDDIIDFAGDTVKNLIDTPVKRYSSGMYVRLAFAIAAHLETDVLLVDEVLAVGDSEFQKKCLNKMDDVAQSGRTVVFVSHNMNAISQLCQRAVLLDSGKLIADGKVSEVISDYLTNQRLSMGEVILEPPVPVKSMRMIKAYVTQDSGQPLPLLSYYKPFHVIIEYEVLQPIKSLRIGFRLHNYEDVGILQTATSDTGVPDESIGSPGKHRAEVEIPGAWLSPGSYYIELGAWSPGAGHHHYLKNALGFEISGADLESVGGEVLRPTLEWNVAPFDAQG